MSWMNWYPYVYFFILLAVCIYGWRLEDKISKEWFDAIKKENELKKASEK